MANKNAERRKNATRDKYDEMLATLHAENPAVADWLEEARDGLMEIFSANPGDAWETLAFLTYLATLLDTVEQMKIRGMLPVVSRSAYEQASRELNGNLSDARANIRRERTFAKNVEGIDAVYGDYEAILTGLPVENGGAKAYCDVALAKLLRMRRLSR